MLKALKMISVYGKRGYEDNNIPDPILNTESSLESPANLNTDLDISLDTSTKHNTDLQTITSHNEDIETSLDTPTNTNTDMDSIVEPYFYSMRVKESLTPSHPLLKGFSFIHPGKRSPSRYVHMYSHAPVLGLGGALCCLCKRSQTYVYVDCNTVMCHVGYIAKYCPLENNALLL